MRIKKLLTISLSIILLLSCTLLEGCKHNPGIIFGNNEPAITYKYDNTVYLAMEKARNLNPLVSKDADIYQISKLIYNGLFEFDDKLIPQPVLVSTYSYDDASTQLALQLKKGIKFADGHELTGEDVKFSIELIQTASKYGEGLYSSYVSNIKSVSVDKSDSSTVTIKFLSAYGSGIENLTFPILPAHLFKTVANARTVNSEFPLIGTGPYTVGNHFELSSLTLVANQFYNGSKPSNELVFQILPNRDYAINMAQSGDVSIFFDNAINKDNILSRYDVSVTQYNKNEVVCLAYNCALSKLSAAKVRSAISYAIDADEILGKAYYKNGVLTDSMFYPNFYGVENTGDLCPKDQKKAKALLAQCGIKDTDSDGILEDTAGNDFSLSILTNADDVQRVKAADLIKDSLSKLGILTEIHAVSTAEFNNNIALRQYDIGLIDISFDERYDLKNLLYSGYGNVFGFSNETVDSILLEMEQGTSFMNRTTLISDLKQELKKQMPYYCLLNLTDACYTNSYFDANPNPLFNKHYNGCETWRCKYPENSDDN